MSSPTPAEAEAAIALLNRVYIDGYSASLNINCYLGQNAVSEYVMWLALVIPFYWWSMWWGRLSWQATTRLYFAPFALLPFVPWLLALVLSDHVIQEPSVHPFCTSKPYALPPVAPAIMAFLLGMTLVHTRYFALPFPPLGLAIDLVEAFLVPFLMIMNGNVSLHQAAAGVAFGFGCVALVAVPFYWWLVPFLFRLRVQHTRLGRLLGLVDLGTQWIPAETWSIL